MSYTIEYARQVFKMPKGTKISEGFGKIAHELYEDEIFVFIKSGCNNVYPRPKDWHLAAMGWNYSVISEICTRAGYTEGGSIKMNGNDTTPENYLKLYRKTIAEAVELTPENLAKGIGAEGFEIAIGKKVSDSRHVKESIETLKQLAEYTGEYIDRQIYRFKITDFWAWYQLLWLGKETDGWHSVRSSQNS